MRRLLLVVACVVLPACYDFPFPLDEKATVANDPRLNGKWRCLPAKGDDPSGRLSIEPTSPTEARWTFDVHEETGKDERSVYAVHGSTLSPTILNVRHAEADDARPWTVARFAFLRPDVLFLQVLDDEPFSGEKTGAALRKALEKRADDPAVWFDML